MVAWLDMELKELDVKTAFMHIKTEDNILNNNLGGLAF